MALTPGLGGPELRLMLVAHTGTATTVSLCGEHYRDALRATLEALLGERSREELREPIRV